MTKALPKHNWETAANKTSMDDSGVFLVLPRKSSDADSTEQVASPPVSFLLAFVPDRGHPFVTERVKGIL